MSEYRFRNKDIETLTRDELLEALKQALDHVAAVTGVPNTPEPPRGTIYQGAAPYSGLTGSASSRPR